MGIENDVDITADLGAGADDGFAADPVINTQIAATPPAARTDDAVTPAPAPAKDEFSLRDQLSKAFTPEEAQTPNPASTAAAPTITQGEDGRWRRIDGTFASEGEIAALNAPAQTNTQQPDTRVAGILSQMTETEKGQFQALPAETREFLVRKMEAVEGQAARYSEYNLLETELLGPRRAAWAQQGMTPATAVQQLFALSDFASRDPTAFSLWFAEQNGVDLDAALDARDAQRPSDPHVAQLQQEVGQLRSTVSTYEQQQQQAAFQRNANDIQSFAEAKDNAGALKHPYLTEVVSEFSANIAAIRAQNPTAPNAEVIQKAYETACWANPNIRSRMQQAAEAARVAEQRAQASRAANASGSINGGPSGTVLPKSPENSNLSLREELARQFG